MAFAVYVIVVKRVRITRSITISGERARLFGITLLAAAIPLSFGIGLALRLLLPRALTVWPIPQILYVVAFAAAVIAIAMSFREKAPEAAAPSDPPGPSSE